MQPPPKGGGKPAVAGRGGPRLGTVGSRGL